MIEVYIPVLIGLILFAVLGWLVSLVTKNVTHVDSMWSLFFVIAMLITASQVPELTDRHIALMAALLLWASPVSYTHLTLPTKRIV